MSSPLALCMMGSEAIVALAEARSHAQQIPLEDALGQLSSADVYAAATAKMPPAVRDAWERGKQIAAVRQRAERAESARQRALAAHPHLRPEARDDGLSADEQAVCRALRMSESEYLTARAQSRASADRTNGLSSSELSIAEALGLTPAAFAAAKSRAN